MALFERLLGGGSIIYAGPAGSSRINTGFIPQLRRSVVVLLQRASLRSPQRCSAQTVEATLANQALFPQKANAGISQASSLLPQDESPH